MCLCVCMCVCKPYLPLSNPNHRFEETKVTCGKKKNRTSGLQLYSWSHGFRKVVSINYFQLISFSQSISVCHFRQLVSVYQCPSVSFEQRSVAQQIKRDREKEIERETERGGKIER